MMSEGILKKPPSFVLSRPLFEYVLIIHLSWIIENIFFHHLMKQSY